MVRLRFPSGLPRRDPKWPLPLHSRAEGPLLGLSQWSRRLAAAWVSGESLIPPGRARWRSLGKCWGGIGAACSGSCQLFARTGASPVEAGARISWCICDFRRACPGGVPSGRYLCIAEQKGLHWACPGGAGGSMATNDTAVVTTKRANVIAELQNRFHAVDPSDVVHQRQGNRLR